MSILECKALTKRYGGKSALEGVELSIEPGRIVGLLGPNGSGKTTLIKLANGLLTPTSGEILIAGNAPCRATKAIVSYLPDRNTLPGWMTIAQALDYYGDFYSDFRRGVAEAMLTRSCSCARGRSCSTRAWRPFEMKRARALTSSSGRDLDAEQTDQT